MNFKNIMKEVLPKKDNLMLFESGIKIPKNTKAAKIIFH